MIASGKPFDFKVVSLRVCVEGGRLDISFPSKKKRKTNIFIIIASGYPTHLLYFLTSTTVVYDVQNYPEKSGQFVGSLIFINLLPICGQLISINSWAVPAQLISINACTIRAHKIPRKKSAQLFSIKYIENVYVFQRKHENCNHWFN